MKLIPVGLILIYLISCLTTSHLTLKQLADYGITSEDNHWCQRYSDCNVLPSKVCRLLANQTSAVISLENLDKYIVPVSNSNNNSYGDDETIIKCKCCVVKGTNILMLRSLWFEAVKHLNELSSRSKDKDNPVTLNPMLTTPTIPSSPSPSSEQQSRTTTEKSSTDSVSIVSSDNLLINTTSENGDQSTPSTDSTITEETNIDETTLNSN